MDLDKIGPIHKQTGLLNVIIETPRGSPYKYSYDPELGLFLRKKRLPKGTAFPYDFGFLPGTHADDGDPLDVLLFMEDPIFPGCLVRSCLIGAIAAEEKTKGKTNRNDRLLAVGEGELNWRSVRSIRDLDQESIKEIESFFIYYNEMKGKKFKVIDRLGPKDALDIVHHHTSQTRERPQPATSKSS